MGTTTKLRSKYPSAFQKCIPEALQYGKCVARSVEMRQHECDKEFQLLSKCFQSSIKTMK